MLQERIEGKWIDAFARVFRLCGVEPAQAVAIRSETQSRTRPRGGTPWPRTTGARRESLFEPGEQD